MYFPLHPETPAEGRSLSDLFAGRESAWEDMHARLSGLMRAEGLQYGERTHTYNSRLAQELALWGDERGATDALHDALFRAYFVEGSNLAEVDVLLAAASSSGLDPEEARDVLETRRYALAGRPSTRTGLEWWQDARRLGVTGVPTFVTKEGRRVWTGVVGAQPYGVVCVWKITIPRARLPSHGASGSGASE